MLCGHSRLLCAQVIDLISLKPFDMETISNSVMKTKHVIIVEECMKTGGIGASLSAMINESLFDYLDHQASHASQGFTPDCLAALGTTASRQARDSRSTTQLLWLLQVVRLSSQDVPTAYAYELEAATIVQPEQVVQAVKDMVPKYALA